MRILLVNPGPKGGRAVAPWPHLGLVLLAADAKSRGHDVLVADYAFSAATPSLAALAADFAPNLWGVTLYTAHLSLARRAVAEIRTLSQAPIAVGGPHASLYAEDLAREGFADAIFRGECDLAFGEAAGRLGRSGKSAVIEADPPAPESIRIPDFNLAWGAEGMTSYPLQLSRGCPYLCSFCSVKFLSTRRVRLRRTEACLDEVERALARWPKLREIRIVDDCPTFDLARFKAFLRGFVERGFGLPLHLDNLRADGVDEEVLGLLKTIGVDHLCIGVESGNLSVFGLIHKGETLDEVVRTARLIKRRRLRLYICFIIGLPGATAASDEDSIRLARALKPHWIYWNQFQPHRGTEARAWFEKHGRLFEEEDKSSLIGLGLEATEAPCDTAGYPAPERVRMHLSASLATGAYWLNPLLYPRYARLIAGRRLVRPFLRGLPAAGRINFEMLRHKAAAALRTRRKRGRTARKGE
jgi:anaerobic magnesium-protoporphyrin IX monomethyl ester cyclase